MDGNWQILVPCQILGRSISLKRNNLKVAIEIGLRRVFFFTRVIIRVRVIQSHIVMVSDKSSRVVFVLIEFEETRT